MKNKSITKLFTAALGILLFNSPAQSQSNLGASCGCPSPVSSRPTVLMSTLAVSGGATDGDLLATNTILTCDKTYILDKKIYVPDGKSLTINPGTVIKGRFQAAATNATCLVVQRGGKIFAN